MTAALKPTFRDRQSYPIAPTRQGSLASNAQSNTQVVQFPSRAERVRQQRSSAAAGALAARSVAAPLSPRQPARSADVSVRSLPTPQQPLWLKALVWTQRSSVVLATVAVGATFAVYGWTVQTQQEWGREFARQEQLQRRERQLIEANAAIAQQLAQQAEQPGANLTVPTNANAIFLKQPTQVAPPPAVDAPMAPNSATLPVRPVGY